MNNISSSQPNPAQIFRRTASIVLFLGIMSIGTSNIVSALITKEPWLLNPLVLIPIYFGSAFFIWKESKIAYLVAFFAFTVSSIHGFYTSFINANEASNLLGPSIFTIATIFNVLFFIVIWSIFFKGYRVIFRSHIS